MTVLINYYICYYNSAKKFKKKHHKDVKLCYCVNQVKPTVDDRNDGYIPPSPSPSPKATNLICSCSPHVLVVFYVV